MNKENQQVADFKVKIVKCDHPKFWYSNMVGQSFPVIDVGVRDYYVMGENGRTMGILIVDAEVIKN